LSLNDAFAEFKRTVNAKPDDVVEARRRRDIFKAAFGSLGDVKEVVPSGSLARGTQKDPIHDVDLVIIFDADHHSDWGTPGTSAADALDHTRDQVKALIGASGGTFAQIVRLARWRNHAVKCFLDDPDDDSGFTVDVMPALRSNGHLLVPEAANQRWIECDPEFLISRVAARHAEWNKFAGSVRMLKRWAADQDIKIKSLVMEALALEHLPRDVQHQPSAIQRFFAAAAYYIEGGNTVVDPAGLCGEVQPDLNYAELAIRLRGAAEEASAAMQAYIHNDSHTAIKRWGNVFGPEFPQPPASLAPAALPAVPRQVKDTPQG